MAQQAPKTLDHPDVKAMQARRDERAKATEAAMKRMDESRPTPTQEENDLAKLGILVDQKQDDGSGPTIISNVFVANEPLPPGGPQPTPYEEKARAHVTEDRARAAQAQVDERARAVQARAAQAQVDEKARAHAEAEAAKKRQG